jgi:hypothetical protein
MAMPDMEQFSALVGDIYDASLDPALWPEVDTIRREANLYFAWGVEPSHRQLYPTV